MDDLNADGWDDIFIASSMNFPYRYQPNAVLLNEAGRRFLPAEFLLGVEPRPEAATSKVWFTLDCKGSDIQSHLLPGVRPSRRDRNPPAARSTRQVTARSSGHSGPDRRSSSTWTATAISTS